jgi:penicillin-binding protein 1C
LNRVLDNKKKIGVSLFVALLFIWWFSIPSTLFETPYSTILEAEKGELLAAKIAEDGQWRFPISDSVSTKFETCITYFEDEYFRLHPGINPISIVRATYQNIKAGRIISGGSTLTMQVVRLSRNNPSRSYFEKFLELFRAIRLEVRYSKNEILAMYTAHAPFGGNVVGLETASWRYYGRSPKQLSWGETATLAVLPNAPSLIYPGKNHDLLLTKRNRLLDKLYEKGEIDELTCELAKEEGLPQKPKALPQMAMHLLDRLILTKGAGKRYHSTISYFYQKKIEKLSFNYNQVLSQNEIANGAVLVVDLDNGKVISYIGNINQHSMEHQKYVNCIHAPRSSGSILKPLLFSHMLNSGHLYPHMMLQDIPTTYGSYRPKNFNRSYDGLVDASDALARSLNVPAVRLLKRYGTELFLNDLRNMGITTMNNSHKHYGLSLILGGGEVKLWDMIQVYSNLGQQLNQKQTYKIHALLEDSRIHFSGSKISALAIYQTFEALLKLNRPNQEEGWEHYEGLSDLAWKTGTSFGHKDAWAIGVTGKYAIGVWIGNADGEGRPGITGVRAAAPLLFQIARSLPQHSWFDPPTISSETVDICAESGYLAGVNCQETTLQAAVANNSNTPICPYHKMIHVDETEQFQVNANCYEIDKMKNISWFSLPPTTSWYYRNKNINYIATPPFLSSCIEGPRLKNIDIIYPTNRSKIKIPKELSGDLGRLIIQAAHRLKNVRIFWHLDEDYLGETTSFHQMSIQPSVGKHHLVLLDVKGNEESIWFEIRE